MTRTLLFRSLVAACALGVAFQAPAQSKPTPKAEREAAAKAAAEAREAVEQLQQAIEALKLEELKLEEQKVRTEHVEAIEHLERVQEQLHEQWRPAKKAAARPEKIVWTTPQPGSAGGGIIHEIEVDEDGEVQVYAVAEGSPQEPEKAKKAKVLRATDGAHAIAVIKEKAEGKDGEVVVRWVTEDEWRKLTEEKEAKKVKQVKAGKEGAAEVPLLAEVPLVAKVFAKDGKAVRVRQLTAEQKAEIEKKVRAEKPREVKIDRLFPGQVEQEPKAAKERGAAVMIARRLREGDLKAADDLRVALGRGRKAQDDDEDDDDEIVDALQDIASELRAIRKLMESVHGRLDDEREQGRRDRAGDRRAAPPVPARGERAARVPQREARPAAPRSRAVLQEQLQQLQLLEARRHAEAARTYQTRAQDYARQLRVKADARAAEIRKQAGVYSKQVQQQAQARAKAVQQQAREYALQLEEKAEARKCEAEQLRQQHEAQRRAVETKQQHEAQKREAQKREAQKAEVRQSRRVLRLLEGKAIEQEGKVIPGAEPAPAATPLRALLVPAAPQPPAPPAPPAPPKKVETKQTNKTGTWILPVRDC